MQTRSRRALLRHGRPGATTAVRGSFEKLAKLGLMAVANLPKLVRAAPAPAFFAPPFHAAEQGKDPDEAGFWIYFGVAFTLVVLGGVFAGLTLGFVSPLRFCFCDALFVRFD